MKKFAIGLMAVVGVVLGIGGTAIAATYPPGAGAPVISPSSPTTGTDFTVTVDCTGTGSVSFTFNGTTKAANCAGGKATVTFTAPATAGTTTGTYSGAGAGGFSVTAVAPVTPPGGLPATGSNGTSTMTIIALGLFAVGAGLFGVSQVRRRQITA